MRGLNAEDEAVVGIGEVPPVRLAVKGDRAVAGYLEQLPQVPGLPLLQQAIPAGPLPLAAPGGAAVVDEDVGGVDDDPRRSAISRQIGSWRSTPVWSSSSDWDMQQ